MAQAAGAQGARRIRGPRDPAVARRRASFRQGSLRQRPAADADPDRRRRGRAVGGAGGAAASRLGDDLAVEHGQRRGAAARLHRQRDRASAERLGQASAVAAFDRGVKALRPRAARSPKCTPPTARTSTTRCGAWRDEIPARATSCRWRRRSASSSASANRARTPADDAARAQRGAGRPVVADMYGMPSDPGCECPVEPIGFEGPTNT
jgi:hypothetical protein